MKQNKYKMQLASHFFFEKCEIFAVVKELLSLSFGSLFLIVESRRLDLTEMREALLCFRCCSGIFYELLEETTMHFYRKFSRPATPGKVHHHFMVH